MIDRTARRFGIKPRHLAADSAYGSAANLAWLVKERQIEPHIPVFDKSNRTDGTSPGLTSCSMLNATTIPARRASCWCSFGGSRRAPSSPSQTKTKGIQVRENSRRSNSISLAGGRRRSMPIQWRQIGWLTRSARSSRPARVTVPLASRSSLERPVPQDVPAAARSAWMANSASSPRLRCLFPRGKYGIKYPLPGLSLAEPEALIGHGGTKNTQFAFRTIEIDG
jgi:hypothetical protein